MAKANKVEEKPAENKKRVMLAKEADAEIEVNKSIFIGHAAPVADEEAAKAFIARIKAEYSDATHNVYAYLLRGGAVARCSDDGEPQGTSGVPTLNVLKMSGVDDLCVVVTRYFGGILLGAGGLVRAYSAAARAALDAAGIVTYEELTIFKMNVNYSDYQKLIPEFPKLGITVDESEFTDKVFLTAVIPTPKFADAELRITDVCGARAAIEVIGTRFGVQA